MTSYVSKHGRLSELHQSICVPYLSSIHRLSTSRRRAKIDASGSFPPFPLSSTLWTPYTNIYVRHAQVELRLAHMAEKFNNLIETCLECENHTWTPQTRPTSKAFPCQWHPRTCLNGYIWASTEYFKRESVVIIIINMYSKLTEATYVSKRTSSHAPFRFIEY